MANVSAGEISMERNATSAELAIMIFQAVRSVAVNRLESNYSLVKRMDVDLSIILTAGAKIT